MKDDTPASHTQQERLSLKYQQQTVTMSAAVMKELWVPMQYV
jgi:hypothetical protein